jgi:hypothetical protein
VKFGEDFYRAADGRRKREDWGLLRFYHGVDIGGIIYKRVVPEFGIENFLKKK